MQLFKPYAFEGLFFCWPDYITGGIVIKGFVIAGTSSGCGKTTITLGMLASLTRLGFKTAPFKVGPDFIDPGHHTGVAGRHSRNLDGWMLSEAFNLETFRKNSQDADIAVVEGVMGLFDGYDGKTEAGSTAQMAKMINLPVILTVNAQSMARSAAALVQGFERFDKDLKFAGVIFNNLGSARHLEYLKEALENNVNMPCLGGILRNTDISIPERHLGLFTQFDHPLAKKDSDRLADIIEESVNIDKLINGLDDFETNFYADGEKTDSTSRCTAETVFEIKNKSNVRIGVAMDNAFCFYYQDNLDMLSANGAELVFFSPVNDKNLPDNIDGIYFGGGYPELFAKQLSENKSMCSDILEASLNSMPVYGECGGFMYLCREIADTNGNLYPMTGCFPFATEMFSRLKALGYRQITLKQDTLIGRQGCSIKGHEYHYSGIVKDGKDKSIETVYEVSPRSKKGVEQIQISEGYSMRSTLGSYIHLHFGSRPECAENFVKKCREYKKGLNK